VIEFSDDEPESLTPSITTAALPAAPIVSAAPIISIAYVIPNILGPSAPCVVGLPDMNQDKEIARRLYVELNREALRIPRDGGCHRVGTMTRIVVRVDVRVWGLL
jgi:hypothetical protein